MKSRIKLAEFTPHLPAQLQDGLDAVLKDTTCQPELHRSIVTAGLDEVDERTFCGYASTRSMDRDGEVVLPGGIDLSQFKKAPVLLWSHQWSTPPIGKDTAILDDGYGLRTRSLMAETPLANDIWALVKGGFLKTSSIGYIPLDFVLRDHKDYGSMMDAARKWPEWSAKSEPRAFITKAVLLEHSLTPVPSCIDALVTSVKQLKLETLAKTLNVPEPPPAPPPAPAAPQRFEPRLVKTAEQLAIEYQHEVLQIVRDELQRRLGRV